METDEDSDDSASRSGTDTPEQSEATTEPAQTAHAPEAEAMDTTPDHSPAPDIQPPLPVPDGDVTQPNATTVRMSVTANLGTNPSGLATLLDNPSLSFNMDGVERHTGEVRVQISNAALDAAREGRQLAGRDESEGSRTRREPRAEEREREDDEDRDDDSEDSSDDEDHPFWAKFKEDTSAPDEAELRIIEQSSLDEVSAVDHEHWEKITFEPLDDPEYAPAETGRISWTVKGIHGTPERPNKERIMRSPSVRIGDFYWNIKFYPRGNDGTEQVSVYVECSPTPYDEEVKEEEQHTGRSNDDADMSETAQAQEGRPTVHAPEENDRLPPDTAPSSNVLAEPLQSSQTLPEETKAEPEAPWRVSAQVACVMYNPDEPRVYASQKSCHSYYNDNPDWGWTRFHGPWEDLHMRKKYQRQALLRNDTLAFTAYVRIVKDETKALWWHPPKEKPQWNSVEMTGVRAFECRRSYQASNLIAALSAWLHLRPFLQIIENVHLPNPLIESEIRPRPILNELRDFVNEKGDYANLERDLSVDMIAAFVDNGCPGGIKKMDVIAMWEELRRRVNFEAADVDTMQQANDLEHDLFQDMLLLKQPDPFGLDPLSRKYHSEPRDIPKIHFENEPLSVQGTIDLASFYPKKAFRVWESFPRQQQEPRRCPAVLHIELHRQHYDQNARKWKKLGHRIAMDGQVTFNHASYTLFGMIVHSGSLESQDYYSVIRPAGPNTRWMKYAGENSPRKVSVLTTKQAITAHEGSGKPDLKVGDKPDKKRENAAVAYIVVYVRTDCLLGVLASPFDRKALDMRKTQASSNAASGSEDEPVQIPAYFYGSDVYYGNADGEIFDPWSRRVKHECQDVYKILLPKTTKLRQIKGLLEAEFAKVTDHGQSQSLNVWLLNSAQLCISVFPTFLVFERYADESLANLTFSEGCRFWVASDNEADATRLIQRLKSLDPSQLVEGLPKVTPADSPGRNGPAGEEHDIFSAQPTNVNAVGDDAAEEGQLVDNTDTVMSDAHNAETEPPPPPPPAASETRHSSESIDNHEQRQTLCFAKVFDWETQTLRSVKAFKVPFYANVVREIKKVLALKKRDSNGGDSEAMDHDSGDVASGEPWDIYHECPTLRLPDTLVGPHSTFEAYYPNFSLTASDIRSFFPGDGACFIAQRRPTVAQ